MIVLLTIDLRCLFSAGLVWFCSLGVLAVVIIVFG